MNWKFKSNRTTKYQMSRNDIIRKLSSAQRIPKHDKLYQYCKKY